jgi:CheY-like chemotaxis protein
MAIRKKFGEILVEARVVDELIMKQALILQKGSGRRLGQILEEMGVISETDIAVAVARQFGFKTVKDIAKYSFPPELLALFTGEAALKQLVFPIKLESGNLFLAMVNPLDNDTLNAISFRTRLRITPCVTTPTEIQEGVARHYLQQGKKGEPKSDWWTILIVDDQELARGATLAALKRQGYVVTEARNGAEGLKAAVNLQPHIIITDTVMTRMDGYEMFDALKRNPQLRSIPVIALSSRTTPEDEAKILDLGFFDFIAKPINPLRLVARVKRALRLHYGDVSGPPQ